MINTTYNMHFLPIISYKCLNWSRLFRSKSQKVTFDRNYIPVISFKFDLQVILASKHANYSS